MKNKKAVLGPIITTFVATIVIIIILVLFAVFSGFLKQIQNSGTKIKQEFSVRDVNYAYKFENHVLFRQIIYNDNFSRDFNNILFERQKADDISKNERTERDKANLLILVNKSKTIYSQVSFRDEELLNFIPLFCCRFDEGCKSGFSCDFNNDVPVLEVKMSPFNIKLNTQTIYVPGRMIRK
jgi:hypothetical protein